MCTPEPRALVKLIAEEEEEEGRNIDVRGEEVGGVPLACIVDVRGRARQRYVRTSD
jgi:hypothetical protein